MGKSLIITEKPSVAQEFARVLGVSGRKDGCIENQEYVITWCVGHLVGLVYPESYDIKYKKWRLEDLPFLPKEYKYDVIKDVSHQYDIVHGMLMREDIDRVYWAGDAGKEGQTIEENIRNYGGVREGMEELRVWIDSQTEEEILRGIREAKPMSEYANLGKSGIMRTIEDYAMGINFSRVMSVKYGNLLNNAAGTQSYTPIAVGRVMTCVLGMVVIREREIRNFKETPFYRIVGKFSDAGIEGEWKAVEGSKYFESPLLYKENGFREEKDAQALIESVKNHPAVVQSVEKGISRKKAPLLFNLAELQAECAKRFKISPDETLQIAQDLYEKKLTTYPRTDARVLSSAVAKEISRNISRLKGFEPTSAFVERIMEKKLFANIAKTQYTDDSKVTDHYAIIPTGQLTELGSLNSLQKAVFELIVRRFLSIFYPPAEYQNVKLIVAVDVEEKKERFFASAKVLKRPGYLEIAGIPGKKDKNDPLNEERGLDRVTAGAYNRREDEEEDSVDPKALLTLADSLKNGDEISVQGYSVKEGKTSPPKRYTSGSMVLAMENAGQLIEEEELREQIKGSGIGTSATRAEIIKKLVRIHYLNLNKRTQVLTPENLGEMVYEVVNMTVPALLNPKMTASWEKGLDGITQGTVDFWDYRTKLENFIRTETEKMIGQNLREPLAERISEFAGKNARGAGARRKIGVVCPACGGEMVTTPFGYGCGNYKSDKTGCNFNIGEIAGVQLSEEQVKELLEKGHTDTIRGFKSRNGKRFDACLKLSKADDGKVSVGFDFSDVEPEILPDVTCPACGGAIKKTSFGYGCVNYDPQNENSCRFSIGKIAGKNLSATSVKQLLTEGHTDTIRGFKSKAGKKFDACLCLEKDETGRPVVQFDFENVERKVIKDVKCPFCGGEIVTTSFGYGCVNYKPKEESSCRFSIGKMADKSFTETQVRQLLTEGVTETIRGFKAKSGKRFDARVALAKDESGKVTGLKFDFNNVEPKKVKDVKCPKCGGDIVVAPFGFVCENHRKDDPDSCSFVVGKIASVRMKESQLKELLLRKKTDVITGFVAKTGMKFDAPLKLTETGDIAFDFPEKPKPVPTTVPCPGCGKMLMKSQWKYECECGFQVWHTLAHVELSEDIMRELLTTGKTRQKVTGFTSKAGNMFDTCLKYENGQISFDFDNPGEPVKENESKVSEESDRSVDLRSNGAGRVSNEG
ncbi:MAG: topoisomerase C-terminal repeat-containing protein [Lachnospiraceae bacterium]|nr:topoisomerase C-terminal repeat-containing protein [Agathobacter sp.]MDD6445515.1 topoisomerase C-terminal repeat-containing protein [Lachnospiraceae bacterium]MDY4893010.1 topoisomerase C-terminal repeat-containing protein [Agathobacter sp.]